MIFPTWFYFLVDEFFNWQIQLGSFYLWMKPTSLPPPLGFHLSFRGFMESTATSRLMDEIFPTWLYCGWMQTANLVVLWMNGLPTWFYFMCHFYYFELWIGEGYVLKPVLASYWKRTRLSIKVQIRVSEDLPIDFTFFAIPGPEPTWPGMSVLDILIVPYWQGINLTKSNTLPIPWWGPLSHLPGHSIFHFFTQFLHLFSSFKSFHLVRVSTSSFALNLKA